MAGDAMYNRYIPQSDGSFKRRPTQDQTPQPAPPPESHKPEPEPHYAPPPPRPTFGIQSFLRQILPKNFDIGDLIVVLLLLLMAADREEEQNNALLTLALYLFM